MTHRPLEPTLWAFLTSDAIAIADEFFVLVSTFKLPAFRIELVTPSGLIWAYLHFCSVEENSSAMHAVYVIIALRDCLGIAELSLGITNSKHVRDISRAYRKKYVPAT